MKHYVLFIFTFCIIITGYAQIDPFVGTWDFEKLDPEKVATYKLSLQISQPEEATLYPALLTISYAQFIGVYQVLLVKKNNEQLAIGRQKFTIKEEPFGLGAYTIPLNGTLDIIGGNSLSVNRIKASRYGFAVPALSKYEESNKMAVLRISEFLRNDNIQFQKKDAIPWRSAAANKMLYSYEAPTYFGLTDSFYVNTAEGSISVIDNNKSDDDTVSVSLNKKMIIEKTDIRKKTNPLDIKLDTGMNILCFFADNYGKVPPNTAKLNLQFGNQQFTLDYAIKENMSATFIVAKIFLLPNQQQKEPENIFARKTITQKIQQRTTKLIDSVWVGSQEVTLAIWDDAVEDGDSISLQINDEIFMQGLAVKKKPQFIKLKLYRGENKIIFIADNLGSIAPNTSILEIIDGKKRRAYNINTNLGQNNAIKIIYEL
ncbi:MAG: hypothetical protein WEA59_03340 [Ferruginibacter sp.]